MLTVCLKALFHRQKENIAICYPRDAAINNIVRKLKGVKWSQTNKCWYLPLSAASYKAIHEALRPQAVIDDSLLKNYLQKKKQVTATAVASSGSLRSLKPAIHASASPAWKLSKENLGALQKFVERLKFTPLD